MSGLILEGIVVLLIAGVAFLSVLAVRRLFFHPLSSVPGPKLAAITWYYLAYYDLVMDGGLVDRLETLHEQYGKDLPFSKPSLIVQLGPVVRVAPEKLHFNDPRAYDDIYSTGSKFTKDPRFYCAFEEEDTSFGSVDPRQAKLRKDVMRPLFSRRAIIKLEGVVQHSVDRLINALLSHEPSTPINMFYGFLSTNFEVITSYCFAQPYEAIDAPDFRHPILVALQSIATIAIAVQYFPILNLVMKMPLWLAGLISKESAILANLMDKVATQIDQLIADPSSLEKDERENIYHHLLTPHLEKNGNGIPGRKSLIKEALVLIGAGTDTVANASTVATFHVLHDQNVLEPLVDELIDAWPDKEMAMGFEKLEKLPYLTAVIKESLRLSIGATMPLPRVVSTDTVIGGIVVPAGSVVGMGQSFMHYNSDAFPDPQRFDPQRWLQADTRQLENHFVPFSKGPRSCLGMNLAWCELYLLLGNIFRKVEIEIFDTTSEDMRIKAFLVPKFRGKPLRVYAKRRIV